MSDVLLYTRPKFQSAGMTPSDIAYWDWLSELAFRHPSMTPVQLRQLADTGCLKWTRELEQQQAPQTRTLGRQVSRGTSRY